MKETGITLSIIIPVYNVMAYLRPCLDGLLSQTCPAGFSYEVLLADDGSTDGSGAVCDEYAAAYRQVRALHRENGVNGIFIPFFFNLDIILTVKG